MYDAFGIIHFFDNDEELETLKEVLSITNINVEEPDRAEYGDFQTNSDLANKVTLHLASKNISPEVVIEPTCGKGNRQWTNGNVCIDRKEALGWA